MRQKLSKIYGIRDRFYGIFERMGTKSNWKTGALEETVLLLDIRDKTGKTITDHLWFNYVKGFQELKDLKTGDLIRFEARVDSYSKGYERNMIDYKLSRPTKIVKIRSILFKS